MAIYNKSIYTKDNFQLNLFLLLIFLFPIIASFFLSVNSGVKLNLNNVDYSINLPCISQVLFHKNCPSCGMTRCFIYMSEFDFNHAFIMNRAGVFLYVFFLVQIIYRILSLYFILKNKIEFSSKYFNIFQTISLTFILSLALYDFFLQFL